MQRRNRLMVASEVNMSSSECNVESEAQQEAERARRVLEAVWRSDVDDAHLQNGCAERLSLEVDVGTLFFPYFAPRVNWYLRQKHVEGRHGVIPQRSAQPPQIEIISTLWWGEERLGGVVGIVSVGGLEPQTHHSRRRMAVEALAQAVTLAWTDLFTLNDVELKERGIELFPTVEQIIARLKSDFHD